MTEYSRSVEDWNCEDWEFTSRNLIESKVREECEEKGIEDWQDYDKAGEVWEKYSYNETDSQIPIMSYCYPLHSPISRDPYMCEEWKEKWEKAVLKINEKTNRCVVQNTKTEEYFLALTGGGMDMSQDVGLAYIIIDYWIPQSLIREISVQRSLSIREEDFDKILKPKIIEQLKMEIDRNKDKIKEWKKK